MKRQIGFHSQRGQIFKAQTNRCLNSRTKQNSKIEDDKTDQWGKKKKKKTSIKRNPIFALADSLKKCPANI